MSENQRRAAGWGIKEKLTRKWKARLKLVAIILMAGSGFICSLGLGDSINTHEIVEEPVMDEHYRMGLSEEEEYQYTQNFREFSSSFLGKVETYCFLIPTFLEIERTPTLYLSFLLVHKKVNEVADNFSLSIDLLFQLKEVKSGIVLEAEGDPGEFELRVIETGKAIAGVIEFHLIVYARVFSPSIEYLGPALSLLLTGITLFLLGSANWVVDRVFLILCGLGGMPGGALLLKYTIQFYSYFYLPYLGTVVLLFLFCLALVLNNFSLNPSRTN